MMKKHKFFFYCESRSATHRSLGEQQGGTNNIRLPDRWRQAVRVDGGFGSYRWFVYITTLLLQDGGPPEPPQRHLYCQFRWNLIFFSGNQA